MAKEKARLPQPKHRKPRDPKTKKRPSRREAEDAPSVDYLDEMGRLGPRERESQLAFRKRMFVIEGTRDLWLRTWREHAGDRVACATALGIPRNNISYELRQVGLDTDILDELVAAETVDVAKEAG